MQRSTKIGLFVLLIAVVSFTVILLTPGEPAYEGKTLSEWLDQIDLDARIDTNSPAAKAIRHMGTNAVPHLLELMQPDISPEEQEKLEFGEPTSGIFPRQFFHQEAAVAFGFLGPVAESAIPELSRLLRAPGELGYRAGWALGGVGPKGTDVLIDALADESIEVQRHAMHGLGASQTADNRHITAILENMENPNLRSLALGAQGRARQAPSRTIPVLIGVLRSTNKFERSTAMHSLRHYRAAGKPAIPALFAITNMSERPNVRWAISEIDPSALAEFDRLSDLANRARYRAAQH